MPAPLLSVRSERARDLAHRLAQRENTTVTDIVERALALYEVRSEPAASFYERLRDEYGTDIDLEEVIRSGREAHDGIVL